MGKLTLSIPVPNMPSGLRSFASGFGYGWEIDGALREARTEGKSPDEYLPGLSDRYRPKSRFAYPAGVALGVMARPWSARPLETALGAVCGEFAYTMRRRLK